MNLRKDLSLEDVVDTIKAARPSVDPSAPLMAILTNYYSSRRNLPAGTIFSFSVLKL